MAELAMEQSELRRIATLAVANGSIAEVCTEVARAAAVLFGAELGVVARFSDDGQARVEGRHCVDRASALPLPGGEIAFEDASALGRLRSSEATVRLDQGKPSWSAEPVGERIATPIKLSGEIWGGLIIAAPRGRALPADIEHRLVEFTELVALAIANAQSHEQLMNQAMTDSLTGLANHRAFSQRLEQEIARAQRHRRPLALLVLDIDEFKTINDTLGHLTGDLVLAQVADTLRGVVRSEATVARIGGDEFALILPETDHHQAGELRNRCAEAIRENVVGAGCPVTSVGTAAFEAAMNASALREAADRALYVAKRRDRPS